MIIEAFCANNLVPILVDTGASKNFCSEQFGKQFEAKAVARQSFVGAFVKILKPTNKLLYLFVMAV
ncbi:hypothetical protein A3Q56_08410 [Intoshia linei]|uniref:Uncharacterized protein n=1 Tax=Intoshia linei TaxID=1819745 RepID=A0A177APC8_9BILA|nr:hypothetical protein A3Q56_08410 [Intoshia linei]